MAQAHPRSRRPIRTRLLLAFLLPAVLLFTAVGAVGYVLSRELLEDELGRSLGSVAGATASQLSAERLLSLAPGDDTGQTRTFRNQLRVLAEARAQSGVSRLFAVTNDGTVLLDTAGEPIGTRMPELERDRLELERVHRGERAASQVLFEGQDGTFYKTGYAPLLLDGKVVGAVGVEGSAAFFRPLRRLWRGFAVAVVLGLLVIAGVAVLTARSLARPLQRLMRSALRIGGGDLSTPVPPERTLEIGVLAHELEQMRGALESRDRQLQMMLAGVAHEVRNPIGGMELFAGLLAEELGPADGDAREHIERIQREIRSLKRIVEDFLAFAREHKVAPARLPAPRLLESARAHLEGDASTRKVVVSVHAEDGELEVDEGLLLSAITNLVKNAIQASPEGGSVTLHGTRRDGVYCIDVRNRGDAIPSEVRSRIFEPFFTTRQQGTGLGLPLAKKILQAHRGTLELVDDPAETVFRVTLPAQSRG